MWVFPPYQGFCTLKVLMYANFSIPIFLAYHYFCILFTWRKFGPGFTSCYLIFLLLA